MLETRAIEKVQVATRTLKNAGIAEAFREAEVILSHCLGVDRIAIYRDNPVMPEHILAKIDGLIERRSRREPLQYIIGDTEFHGLQIKVGPGVLIPRPETELLVEEAVKKLKGYRLRAGGNTSSFILHPSSFRILDLCTGSGCIALSLAKEFPDAEVYGSEISGSAIRYARENASINEIKNVIFLEGVLFEPIQGLSAADGLCHVFDLITANPPYIRRSEIEHLQPEVRDWEPAEALDGGEDGMDYYRLIIPGATEHLKEEGCLICELGIGQSQAVGRMALEAGFKKIALREDYAGIERILVAEKE